uniref:Uncharacterized protein n=1 Tax=Tetranychus urticae TaxID=32264 RepID=T1K166_TETUR
MMDWMDNMNQGSVTIGFPVTVRAIKRKTFITGSPFPVRFQRRLSNNLFQHEIIFTKIDSSTPSPAVDAKSLIEDSVDQANQLLIDLEEQIKLGINQGIEDDYEPLNIFSSSLPLSYGFKFSTSNFLFRPIFKATSVTSKLHSPTGTLDANDDIIDPPSTIDSIDTNNNNDELQLRFNQ